MLGYCGIDCTSCPAYQGTVSGKRELLEKAMGEYGDASQSIVDWICLGCTPPDQSFLATYCGQCKIRACAVEKGVQNCAACDSYEACSIIREFIGTEDTELAQRMDWLRKRFLA